MVVTQEAQFMYRKLKILYPNLHTRAQPLGGGGGGVASDLTPRPQLTDWQAVSRPIDLRSNCRLPANRHQMVTGFFFLAFIKRITLPRALWLVR